MDRGRKSTHATVYSYYVLTNDLPLSLLKKGGNYCSMINTEASLFALVLSGTVTEFTHNDKPREREAL